MLRLLAGGMTYLGLAVFPVYMATYEKDMKDVRDQSDHVRLSRAVRADDYGRVRQLFAAGS